MMSSEDIEAVECLLGVTFRKKELLVQALTHRSYLNEHGEEGVEHNERLEFLGDAVVEIVVTEYLIRNLPKKKEGELSKIRAALVNTQSLKKVMTALGVMKYWRASHGEKQSYFGAKNRKLRHEANTLEAIVGAIYLDRGRTTAEAFVLDVIVVQDLAKVDTREPKTFLQEAVQAKGMGAPTYRTLREWGSDHDRTYEVGAYVEGKMVAKAQGKSKKEAQTSAAEIALKTLQLD